MNLCQLGEEERNPDESAASNTKSKLQTNDISTCENSRRNLEILPCAFRSGAYADEDMTGEETGREGEEAG